TPTVQLEYREFCATCLMRGFLHQRRGEVLSHAGQRRNCSLGPPTASPAAEAVSVIAPADAVGKLPGRDSERRTPFPPIAEAARGHWKAAWPGPFRPARA